MIKQLYDPNVKRNVSTAPQLKSGYTRIKIEQVADEEGRLSRSVSYEFYDTDKENKKFKSSDFSLSQILAVGAYDMLKPVFQSRMSDMSLADKFENFDVAAPSSES